MKNYGFKTLMVACISAYAAFTACDIAVKQIRSLSQISGTTCGYYALANAHAMQKLFNESKALSETNIKQEADKLLHNHFAQFFGNNRQLAEENTPLLDLQDTFDKQTLQTSMFNIFGLKNNLFDHAYVIQSMPESLSCPVYIAASKNPDQDGRALINIKTANKKLVHFIYHIGSYKSGHWVYLGVIKEANKAPYIIHLNSTNAPIEISPDVQIAIAHIQKCIEKNIPLLTQETDEQIALRLQKEENERYNNKEVQQAIANKKTEVENDITDDERLAKELQEQEDAHYAHYLANEYKSYAKPIFTESTQHNRQQLIADEALARKLQQEEDVVYARQLQNEEDRKVSFLARLKRFFK